MSTDALARYPDLAGRTVFVTGGGSGIGAAFVRAFAGQGARVGFCDIADEPSRALVARLPGSMLHYARADVRDIPALQRAIGDAARALGPITVLVNNAARDDRHRIEDVTVEFFDERMAVNLRHAYFAIQAVVPGMKQAGGGSIVNFSSVSYHTMTPHLSVYQAAKAAVIGMSRGLARDLGEHGIRVNSITPGWIMTQRQIELWLTPEAEAQLMQLQCLKEKVYPPDIARTALFLGADDSRLITAQTFVVDGGRM